MAPRDPEELEAGGATAVFEIAPHTTVGAVELSVSDLARSIEYYRTEIGLDLLNQSDGRASLGTGERELLSLVEYPGAAPADGYAGLYHFALLVPERHDLAAWLAHAARDRTSMTGLSDHFVSEALYLRDPDHHGIEIYWDRPRELWEGQVMQRMTSLPLNTDDLFDELDDPATEPFHGLPEGTVMGHIHLRATDVDETVTFYRDVLGFGLMAYLGGQAAFFAAGGYHHHLGANSWESRGAGQAPAGRATLLAAKIVLPDEAGRAAVLERLERAGIAVTESDDGPRLEDPSGNPLVLTLR